MPPPNREDLAALERATLEELMERHPEEWRDVGARLVTAMEARTPAAIEAFMREAAAAAAPWRARLPTRDPRVIAAAMPHLVKARMTLLATDRVLFAAATGEAGSARFGLWSGTLIQRLFFARGLERRPVSMRAFRLVWPLVTQKRLLMPLVQPKGIYCFYSRELVREIASIIGDRPAIELAAGDGTLSRFLAAEGVKVRPTDNKSWGHSITYPAEVEKLDAAGALGRYRPRAVVCSFPPPRNTFERAVFASREVERYVVVTSRHRFAAGDWQAYESQDRFDFARDDRLSSLVLPPELDPAVLVFTRRAP